MVLSLQIFGMCCCSAVLQSKRGTLAPRPPVACIKLCMMFKPVQETDQPLLQSRLAGLAGAKALTVRKRLQRLQKAIKSTPAS